MDAHLVEKYNNAVPRYTSYPALPNWENNLTPDLWQESIKKVFHSTENQGNISLYIHLPYCESLCTYCGCNKRITKNHSVEKPYIEALISEWNLYKKLFGTRPNLKELHLGGGTPTFFSAENLYFLVNTILEDCNVNPNTELSIEAHPNNTTIDHLETLKKLGFKRISFGIQDFDIKVQAAINRFQDYKEVEKITNLCRMFGFESINYDLVYGLPFQTIESLKNTLSDVARLKPDRIAFYSYAHVPLTAKGQRLYSENDLPETQTKLQMHKLAKEFLEKSAYQQVGMDHFCLESDSLFKSYQTGKMHRNFMGYTTDNSQLLIGLGVSSISDCGIAYAQNHKTIEEYKLDILAQNLPFLKAYCLSDKDLYFKEIIENLMCNYQSDIDSSFWERISENSLRKLEEMQSEGLIKIETDHIQVVEKGMPFVRNICASIDPYQAVESSGRKFSKAI